MFAVVTPADDLQAWPEAQVVSPVESSWGEYGHASMWLDPVNDWIPQALHGCAQLLAPFARLQRETGIEGRALVQACKDIARAWPAQALWLDTYENAAGAGFFYLKCGFRKVGPTVFRDAPLGFYEWHTAEA